MVKVISVSSRLETQSALKDVILTFNLHILKSHGGGVKEEVLYHVLSSKLIYLRKFKVMIGCAFVSIR